MMQFHYKYSNLFGLTSLLNSFFFQTNTILNYKIYYILMLIKFFTIVFNRQRIYLHTL